MATVDPTSAPHSAPEVDDIRSVAFVSLGCPKNLVDSERMLGVLRDGGIRPVNESDSPDAIVINTCGFLEASKEESLGVIKDALERKARGQLKRVIVAGCLVQRHRAKMLEWAPGIDALVGVFDRDRVLEAVQGARAARTENSPASGPAYWIHANALAAAKDQGLPTTGLTVHGKDGKGVGYFEDDGDRFRLTPRHWAYLRMSEGCNQRCAFCTIPSIRGKMRSKPLEKILAEARALLSDGAFELNLIGQDTTSYGMDIGYDAGLVGLLESLDREVQSHGGGWLRLMYAYPTFFTDEMVKAFARLPNLVKYLDIPLQHASDRMLDLMRRNVTSQVQGDLVSSLRDKVPGMAIRTTFITGFPGETEEDHEELLAFIEEHQFDALGVFKYSREEGTPAGTMDQDPALHVPDDVKERREQEIMELQQRIAFENAAYVAEQKGEFDVLVDGAAAGASEARATTGVSEGLVLHKGRAYHQAPSIDSCTWVASRRALSPGEMVRCTIVESDGYDLVARPTEDLSTTHSLRVLR